MKVYHRVPLALGNWNKEQIWNKSSNFKLGTMTTVKWEFLVFSFEFFRFFGSGNDPRFGLWDPGSGIDQKSFLATPRNKERAESRVVECGMICLIYSSRQQTPHILTSLWSVPSKLSFTAYHLFAFINEHWIHRCEDAIRRPHLCRFKFLGHRTNSRWI